MLACLLCLAGWQANADDAWTGRCDAMRAMRAMDGRAAARGLAGWAGES